MRKPLLASLALATALSVSPALAAVIQVNGNIAANTTWTSSNVYWVRANIGVNAGVTLTIQPGTVVKFDPSTSLQINGILQAVGTVADTIVFTSIRDDNNRAGDTNGDGNATVPAASDWGGIVFPDATTDNTSALTWCDVRFGGYASQAALRFQSCSQPLSNCIIRRSYFGIDCSGSAAPTLSNTSVEASTMTPIVLDFTATPVFSNLVFSSANNGYDAFGLRGGTLAGAATLPKRGATVGVLPITNVTYVLLSALTVNGSLTIDPGVVVKPLAGVGITVNGNLTMNGTAAAGDTITLTSINDDNFGQPSDTNNNGSITAPQRGDWGRIAYAQGATGGLSRCRLRFGTNAVQQGLVEMVNNAIPVSHTVLSEASHGLAIFGVSTPAISDVAINNGSSTPVLMSVSANPTFTNISFLANAITALGIQGENIAVDSRLALRSLAGITNITYYVMNGFLRMMSPAVLRIDPGVVVKFQLSLGGLQIDGGLVADAKPESLIVFTSERDDQYGNPADTNGDGAITTPAEGNWYYVRFTSTTNDAVSKLDYCRLAYGSYQPGEPARPNLWITGAAPPVTHCAISKGQYGIRIDGDGTPLIDQNAIDNCSAAPIVMSALANPTITVNNSYSTNGYNALGLLSETLSANALLRYRPGVGGTPPFAYLPIGTITVPAGVTLAIEPRVVIKPLSTFTVFDVSGAINVVGGAGTGNPLTDQRVVFTSRRDDTYAGDTTPTDATAAQAGDWGRIELNDTAVDPQCVLRNILFAFGASSGNAYGAVSTHSASPRIARVEFDRCRTALTFDGSSQPSLDSLLIQRSTDLPIVASLISNPVYGPVITLPNNDYLALGILGETVAQDVRTPVRSLGGYSNLNYALAGNVTIAFGARWRIDPGVVIKLGRYNSDPMIGLLIAIDGALIADGKPDSLIVFTSSADDAFGQDVKGDGALTQPQPGQWQYIQFNPISNDAESVLDHCRIRYGGLFNTYALRLVSAAPTLTNTVFTSNAYTAVSVEGNSTPTFANCAFDSTTGVPIEMSLVSDPVLTNCQFLGNTYTALGIVNETIAQDVFWRIRAVSGRLNMPYLLRGTLTIGLNATLTMQPGVRVKFTSGTGINIQKALFAEGRTEPDSMIVFTSYRDDFYGGDTNNDGMTTTPAASNWYGITIEGTAIDAQVRFRNCVLRYGGGGTGVLRCVNSSPTVDSCIVQYNAVGISVEGASNPVITGCSIYGNTNFGVNNAGGAFCVKAEGCWWGAASGPNDASATADLCGLGVNAGLGDKVSNNVDYVPWATSGIVNPLLGDVSLNGQVLAYDASLVFQSLVALIVLNPLQTLVADVDGNDLVTGFDGSLILQYVAGIIPAFPAASNRAGEARSGPLAADPASEALRMAVAKAQGDFEVSLGEPRREGGDWLVPLLATGTAPVWSVEARLEGGATALSGLTPVDGGRVLYAHNVVDRNGRVAMGAAEPLSAGEVAVLRFAGSGEAFEAPRLAWARANATVAATGPRPPAPHVPAAAFLAPPAPNPAAGAVTVELGISGREAGADARVRVLDIAGRVVRTLHRGALAAGEHRLTWDLRDGDGRPARAGLYFVQARVGAFAATRRLTVVH